MIVIQATYLKCHYAEDDEYSYVSNVPTYTLGTPTIIILCLWPSTAHCTSTHLSLSIQFQNTIPWNLCRRSTRTTSEEVTMWENELA